MKISLLVVVIILFGCAKEEVWENEEFDQDSNYFNDGLNGKTILLYPSTLYPGLNSTVPKTNETIQSYFETYNTIGEVFPFIPVLDIPEGTYAPDLPRRIAYNEVSLEDNYSDSLISWYDFLYNSRTVTYTTHDAYQLIGLDGSTKPIEFRNVFKEVDLIERYQLDFTKSYKLYKAKYSDLSNPGLWVDASEDWEIGEVENIDFNISRRVKIYMDDPDLIYLPVFKLWRRRDHVDVAITTPSGPLTFEITSDEFVGERTVEGTDLALYISQWTTLVGGWPGVLQIEDSTYSSINPREFDRFGGHRMDLQFPNGVGIFNGEEFSMLIAYNLHSNESTTYIYDWLVTNTENTVLEIFEYGGLNEQITGEVRGEIIDSYDNLYDITATFSLTRLR